MKYIVHRLDRDSQLVPDARSSHDTLEEAKVAMIDLTIESRPCLIQSFATDGITIASWRVIPEHGEIFGAILFPEGE